LGVFHPFAQHIPPRSWQEPWDIWRSDWYHKKIC
jgi:hypothetical protein